MRLRGVDVWHERDAGEWLAPFVHEDRFAQRMRVAQALGAAMAELRAPEAVPRPSGEIGQDADGIEGLGAAPKVAVPPAAKLLAEPGSAPVRMFGQEPLHLPGVLGDQFPSLHHHDACQGSHRTA